MADRGTAYKTLDKVKAKPLLNTTAFIHHSPIGTTDLIGYPFTAIPSFTPIPPPIWGQLFPVGWENLGAPEGGGGGDDVVITALHETTPTYSYLGTAPLGTAPSSSGWEILRITLTGRPPVESHAFGSWANRATLTYS